METLRRGTFFLVAPHSLALQEKDAYSIQEVARLPLIQLNTRSPLGQILQAQFDSLDEPANIVAVTETYQIAKTLAAKGIGATVVDEITAFSEPHDDVQIIPLDSELSFTVNLMYLEHASLPLICQKFIEHLRDHITP